MKYLTSADSLGPGGGELYLWFTTAYALYHRILSVDHGTLNPLATCNCPISIPVLFKRTVVHLVTDIFLRFE